MIICSCNAVSDRTVSAAVASGAASIEEIGERCGAGECCGGCWPELQRILDETAAGRSGSARHAAA